MKIVFWIYVALAVSSFLGAFFVDAKDIWVLWENYTLYKTNGCLAMAMVFAIFATVVGRSLKKGELSIEEDGAEPME